MIDPRMIQHIKSQLALSWNGIHGINHWVRVRENGLKLAQLTGARADIVELFAFIHDSQRENDSYDPEHGLRAAQFARELFATEFYLDTPGLELLTAACEDHSNGKTTGDITVLTCWDADRLDLGRVGIKPRAKFLCTNQAKSPTIINWAYKRSVTQPDFDPISFTEIPSKQSFFDRLLLTIRVGFC